MPATRVAGRERQWWLLTVALYALVLWFLVPHGIGTSWRECDTQAIARNFVRDGFDPLRPRVDWRGDTDGAVECEFPLYELAIGAALVLCGDVEWPGRLLSLASMVVAAAALHRLLQHRAGAGGALAGLLVFLCSGSAVMLGVRVMPDATSLAFGLVGLVAFARFLRHGRNLPLAVATLAVALAALQKPLALQLGIAMFVWTLAGARRRLRERRLWLAFAAMVLPAGAWLAHGACLHAETGLSFGVVSGGDTKFPDLRHLVDPAVLAKMAITSLRHGFSALAIGGLLVAVCRRRLGWRETGMLLAAALGLFVSFRYSHDFGLGPHYHVFAAAAGAACVARAWPAAAPRWLWAVLLAAAAAHGVWRLQDERGVRNVVNACPMVAAAEALRFVSSPADLLVVRSDKPRLDADWERRNNFEDPRLFYQAERRGWVLPRDEFEPAMLAELHDRGARFVFDPLPGSASPAVRAWLASHGELLFDEGGVRLFRLGAPD